MLRHVKEGIKTPSLTVPMAVPKENITDQVNSSISMETTCYWTISLQNATTTDDNF